MANITSEGTFQRKPTSQTPLVKSERVPSDLETEFNAWLGPGLKDEHPIGKPRHGSAMQALRIIAFTLYFFTSCLFIHLAQLCCIPFWLIDREWFDAAIVLSKQYFGILATTMTYWWSPTVIRVSGDKSMAGLIKQDANGLLQVDFGPRIVLMANHQIYTEWLYLWWIAYTNAVPMHGSIYIILKESLRYAPVLGPAMMLYGFIFMKRKWSTDKERMRYRLNKLSTLRPGQPQLDPMWLLIFPEGTNLSANTRASSQKFAAKSGIPDLKHLLLPRSTGLQFCLSTLGDTVDYLYDCTIGYEGIPDGAFGQDIFTLRSVYFQGRPPKSVNMHWRRFRISEMPLHSAEEMSDWVLARWREKDELLTAFKKDGKFPADTEAVEIDGAPKEKEWKTRYINTEVRPRVPWEFTQMFVPALTALLVGRVFVQLFDRIFGKESLFR